MRLFLGYQKTNIRNNYVNSSVTKFPEHLNTKIGSQTYLPASDFHFIVWFIIVMTKGYVPYRKQVTLKSEFNCPVTS